MSFLAWIRSAFAQKQPSHSIKTPDRTEHRLSIENLEYRRMLSAASSGFSADADADAEFSLTPVTLGDDVTPITVSQPSLLNAGDYYWSSSERISLRRSENEILVKLAANADKAAVIDALFGSPGVALRNDVMASLDSRTIVLLKPSIGGAGSYAALRSLAESVSGVAWTAPVFVGADGHGAGYLTGEIEIALRRDVDPAAFFAEGFSGWRRVFDNQFLATVAEGGSSALQLANDLLADPSVEWAQPSFAANFQVSTNDPLFNNQWHLNNTGQTGAKIDADSDLEEAWNVSTGGPQIVVAVLDNGVQTNHPDLSIFVNSAEIAGNGVDDDQNGFVDDVNGWDFAGNTGAVGSTPDNDPNPFTADDNHGTAVAGVVAALGGNGVGVTGAAQDIEVLPIKIARNPGNGGGFIAYEQIAKAVYYAAGIVVDAVGVPTGATWRGADILVNSWGGDPNFPSSILTAAFDYIQTHGRNGLGVASFNASGNAAAGTTANLNYQTFTLNGIPAGNWIFEWRYAKNSANAAGEDSAWLANMRFPNGATQRFDTPGLPAGWSTSGSVGWSVLDDPAHAYGTGRYVAKAGAIGNNQTTNLQSPTISVGATGNLSFSYWVSSETSADTLQLWISNNGGASFSQQNFSRSGAPVVTTAVAYPANVASNIAVGASTDWDYRSHYSQFGSALDIVAPSSGGYAGIHTTDRTGEAGYNRTGTSDPFADPLSDLDYTSAFSGTSSATPLAAGVAALMLSTNANLTPAQIRTILQSSADKIGGNSGATAYAGGFNQYYGYGRVNALGAVYMAFTPAAPILHGLSDSGLNSTDGITNDTTPTFWGAVPPNSFVRLFVDGVERGSQQLAGGNTTFEITSNAVLSEGQRNITIRVAENSTTSLANMSYESPALQFTIDTTAPPAPTVPDLHALWDTGVSNSDNITRYSSLYFTGAGPLDMWIALLETTSGETQVGQFYTGSVSNSWSISTTGTPLVDGIHHFVARATDWAGNIATSLPIAVLIDSVAPSVPSIPDLLAADDTGVSGADDITHLTSLRFAGAADPNISVSLLSGSTPVGSSTSDGSGAWQVTSSALANGAHNISAVSTDVAGNTTISTSRPVIIDTTAAKVTNVTISGSTSTHTPFAFDNPGNDATDFDGSGIQLRTVPVGGADTVSITFSEHVSNIVAGHLTLVGLAFETVPQLATGGFSYDSSTFKATWRFNAPLPADQYVISLSDAAIDVAANALDGEWTNPFSVSTINAAISEFPSGNGTAGGNFIFVMTILPGDNDLDNVVDGVGFLQWQQMIGGPGRTFSQADYNGDGYTNSADQSIQNANFGIELLDLVYADFDHNGIVDYDDLNILTGNFGHTSPGHEDGDADRDGDVDADDELIWERQFELEISWVL